MNKNRPPIPNKIKREVRQRCGFGCVICGNPIFDYDHIEEYYKIKTHKASGITLLCPFHHREKTVGRLPKYIVIEANKNPFNIKTQITGSNKLYFRGNSAEVILGNTAFITVENKNENILIPLIVYSFAPIILKIKDEELLIDVILKNKDDEIVLLIKDNELSYSIGVWDIEYIGKTLIMREKAFNIFIEIDFLIPNVLHLKKGKIYHNGKLLQLNSNGIYWGLNNIPMLSNLTIMSEIGLVIDDEESDYGCGIFYKVDM